MAGRPSSAQICTTETVFNCNIKASSAFIQSISERDSHGYNKAKSKAHIVDDVVVLLRFLPLFMQLFICWPQQIRLTP